MKRLEKSIEEAVVQWARREKGLLVTKTNQVGNIGLPDRIVWIPGGRPLLLEFKRPGGRLSPAQLHYYTLFHRLGYQTEVADDVDYAKVLIEGAIPLEWDGQKRLVLP